MKRIILKIKERSFLANLINRETISYAIAGVFTTLINIVSYEGLYRLGVSNLRANFIAWLLAVTFAYIANKWTVFHSKSKSYGDEARKLISFFAARSATLGVEQVSIFLLVELMGLYRWIIKGSLYVVVIILNFILSKRFVFLKNRAH